MNRKMDNRTDEERKKQRESKKEKYDNLTKSRAEKNVLDKRKKQKRVTG